MNAKNWLIIYYLFACPTTLQIQKRLKRLLKNAIIASLPVTEGTPFFISLCVMHFRQSQVVPFFN